MLAVIHLEQSKNLPTEGVKRNSSFLLESSNEYLATENLVDLSLLCALVLYVTLQWSSPFPSEAFKASRGGADHLQEQSKQEVNSDRENEGRTK